MVLKLVLAAFAKHRPIAVHPLVHKQQAVAACAEQTHQPAYAIPATAQLFSGRLAFDALNAARRDDVQVVMFGVGNECLVPAIADDDVIVQKCQPLALSDGNTLVLRSWV